MYSIAVLLFGNCFLPALHSMFLVWNHLCSPCAQSALKSSLSLLLERLIATSEDEMEKTATDAQRILDQLFHAVCLSARSLPVYECCDVLT